MIGLQVVDDSGDIAGAYCTRLLATCGATVVKIEPPTGDPLRHQPPFPRVAGASGSRPVAARFEYLNSFKRGITVDTSAASGQHVRDSLYASADVIVSSCNGDPERALLADDEIRRRWSRCVHVVTSPYGLTGPYATYRGSELTNWASGGFLQITGDPDREPVQGGGPWADYATGATAAVAALAAVRSAAIAGVGELVDVGTMEVMAALHQWSVVLFTHQGVIKRRAGNRHAESFHPMGPLPCRDGFVAVGTATVPQWEAFCIAIDQPELLVDERFQTGGDRFDNADALNAELFPRLSEIDADELVERLQDAHVPASKVLDVASLLDDRQLAARRYWAELQVGSTTAKLPSKPFRIASADPPFRPAPRAGEHSEEILRDLGYDAAEVEVLVASGAVGVALEETS